MIKSKSKTVFGVLAILSAPVNPLVAVGFLGACAWEYYSDYRTEKAINEGFIRMCNEFPMFADTVGDIVGASREDVLYVAKCYEDRYMK